MSGSQQQSQEEGAVVIQGERFGNLPFYVLYNLQKNFQNKIAPTLDLPADSPEWFSYHMQGMMEELGEVLKADKRWKTHRNECFAPDEKLDELADVFITALNLAIFSGVDAHTMAKAIVEKVRINMGRFENQKEVK